MTCIVGFIDKKENRVVIGGDYRSSYNGTFFTTKDPKVFRRGEFIFGACGSKRTLQLIMYSFEIPEINNKDIFAYLCTDFIRNLRECFKENGDMRKTDEIETDRSGSCFLLGYKNRLFQIQYDFTVIERIDEVQC